MDNKDTVKKVVKYTNIFARNRDSKAFVIINVGGARSSKSYSICQLLISKLVSEKKKTFGICRKTFPALRMTAMKLFFDLIKEYGIYEESRHNKTFNTYEHGNNLVQFFGLDETEKVKSTEFNYLWMEEANEFSYGDYTNLKLRLSGQISDGNMNHLYLSLNPIDAHNWIATRASKERDVEVVHSTFEDNPFLSKEYINTLLELINQDENFYRVYTLGEWGLFEGKVYNNYTVIPEMPAMESAKWSYGLDFGLVNPSTLIKVYLFQDRFYVEEKLYRAGMTNSDIIEFLSHQERGDIYGDPSAKQMLEEIRRAGYPAFEGYKGVKEGIDLCQRQKLYIPESSQHLLKEIRNYAWKKDKEGHFLPEPVKYEDHCVDAMRYAIWGITERFGFATQRPRSSEPIKTLTFGDKDNNNQKALDRWMKRE